jgi:acetate kinase
VNDTFALPREYYDKGVRRYGFHGLSYEYITGELKTIAPLLHDGRVVVAHLGNGASMCAILGGRSVASTMGFTALDGLPMGTRCGQIDPGVIFYMVQQEGKTIDEVRDLFYYKSGLLGMSGISNDMRTLEAADVPEAHEAIDYFVFRIRRELGGLAAALGGLDALIFCGGIGENSRKIRRRICEGMSWIGLELDHDQNDVSARVISTEFSRARIMVIPTNEELVIARACKNLLARQHAQAAE